MSVQDHIAALPEARRAEAERLDAIFREVSGWAPELWRKVIGYGRYDYKYPTGNGGTSFATGFNHGPREISLHIMPGYTEFPEIAARLGPHRRGKSCWYFRRLDKVPDDALADLIAAGLEDLGKMDVVSNIRA